MSETGHSVHNRVGPRAVISSFFLIMGTNVNLCHSHVISRGFQEHIGHREGNETWIDL